MQSQYEANIGSSRGNIVYNIVDMTGAKEAAKRKEEKKGRMAAGKDFFIRFTPTKAATC